MHCRLAELLVLATTLPTAASTSSLARSIPCLLRSVYSAAVWAAGIWRGRALVDFRPGGRGSSVVVALDHPAGHLRRTFDVGNSLFAAHAGVCPADRACNSQPAAPPIAMKPFPPACCTAPTASSVFWSSRFCAARRTSRRRLRCLRSMALCWPRLPWCKACLRRPKLYWIRTPRFGGWIYGPYVNHNHYAGLMEMLAPIPLIFALTRRARGPRKALRGRGRGADGQHHFSLRIARRHARPDRPRWRCWQCS